jgi:acyl-coenzyme A thioesterase PaaI-like protein
VMAQSTMNFFKNPLPGSMVEAHARMVNEGRKTGYLEIDLRTDKGDHVARFQALVYFPTEA